MDFTKLIEDFQAIVAAAKNPSNIAADQAALDAIADATQWISKVLTIFKGNMHACPPSQCVALKAEGEAILAKHQGMQALPFGGLFLKLLLQLIPLILPLLEPKPA